MFQLLDRKVLLGSNQELEANLDDYSTKDEGEWRGGDEGGGSRQGMGVETWMSFLAAAARRCSRTWQCPLEQTDDLLCLPYEPSRFDGMMVRVLPC